MKKIIKKFRIYELRTNGQVLPVLSKQLGDTYNWFDDEFKAVVALQSIQAEPTDSFIILPTYLVAHEEGTIN